jgi:hypothetical protein
LLQRKHRELEDLDRGKAEQESEDIPIYPFYLLSTSSSSESYEVGVKNKRVKNGTISSYASFSMQLPSQALLIMFELTNSFIWIE